MKTREEVLHVANLARIKLNEEETKVFNPYRNLDEE